MKKNFMLIGTLCLALLTAGCVTQRSEPEAPAASTQITYSNLTDDPSRELLNSLLSEVPQPQLDAFYTHVDQFNAILEPQEHTDGFETRDFLSPGYDPYDLQARWDAAYPDFFGYNCRITAYTLFGDHLVIPQDAEIREDAIRFDLLSLEEDPSAFPGQEQAFSAFYSAVPTENTKDVAIHLANVQKDWDSRGISFVDDPEIRLISMFFHDALDETNQNLFIGHTGVLLPVSDTELYFVEKLAFQAPYQCIRFGSRQELNDYLMGRFDLDYDQPNAAPFIMENDQLMEGYRVLPKGDSRP